jgi:ATP-dependent DNA helicase DinG
VNIWYALFKHKFVNISFRRLMMHSLNQSIFTFFEEKLPQHFENQGSSAEIRWEQITMSQLIANSIVNKKAVAIEAKVGTGKTLAYLFPMHFMQNYMNSYGPVIISTSSINLQEQIINKDLKFLDETGHHYKAIVAKGSQQYLCKLNLENNKNKIIAKCTIEEYKNLSEWVKKTGTGDRSSIGELNNDIWKLISIDSTKDCNNCPFYYECKYWKVRSEFRKPDYDFIITNHNQLLQDLKARYEGQSKTIFPNHISAIVIDEAHNLEQAGITLYSEKFNIRKLSRIFKKVISHSEISISSHKKTTYSKSVELFETQIKNEIKHYKEIPSRISLPNTDEFISTLKYITKIFKDLLDTVYLQIDKEDHYLVEDLNEGLEFIGKLGTDSYIIWYEPDSYDIVTLPKSIAKSIDDLLIHQNKNYELPIIMTSATLSSNNSFDYFYRTIGLDKEEWDNVEKELPSPFSYTEQSLLYVAKDIPEFKRDLVDNDYSVQIDTRIHDLLKITNGRALILYTSHEHMKKSYDYFKSLSIPWKMLSQSDGSKEHVSNKFKNSLEPTVLFATGAFWEGFDIPGEQLINVIIVRLPFSPSDPYIEFKKEEAKKQNLNDFYEVIVPEMIIKMKQGFGRLIRKKNDYGIVSILDPRLLKNKYGDMLLNALPEIELTTEINHVKQFIQNKQSKSNVAYQTTYTREQVEYIPLPYSKQPEIEQNNTVAGIIPIKEKKEKEMKRKYSCSLCGKDNFLKEKPNHCPTDGCSGRNLIEGYSIPM